MPLLLSDPDFERLLLSLWYAIISGIIYSLIGYFKRREPIDPATGKPVSENFSGDLFLTSVVIGVIGGFVAFYLNITSEQAVQMILAETGILYYIENVVKAIWRRWIQPWIEKKAPTPPP